MKCRFVRCTPDKKHMVLAVLNHKDSWGIPVKESTSDCDFIVTFASDSLLRHKFPTAGGLSITYSEPGAPPIIYFNEHNWNNPVKGHTLESYRTYVINHEFGHVLGRGHSPARPGPCKVMYQQTKGLEVCSACPWPRICGDI